MNADWLCVAFLVINPVNGLKTKQKKKITDKQNTFFYFFSNSFFLIFGLWTLKP